MEAIVIRDAYEHNLKHIDLDIPIGAFTCVTGCSGCGKSSLVFDTIYAESQREFLEGMSGNLYGQKLANKPKVGLIENLHPALDVSQNYYNVNPRSTVGTVTEIAYYLRSLFAATNGGRLHGVSESTFSSNNPKSVCPNCAGLGVENIISESLLIPNRETTLRDGAILFFKGAPDSREQKYLEALCDHYGIDINKQLSELNHHELDVLLHADDQIRYKLSYKEGKRRKQHYVYLKGAIPSILDRIKSRGVSEQTSAFGRFMEEKPCHICNGSKLRQEILAYKVEGLNYDEVEHMELTTLRSWLKETEGHFATSSEGEIVSQLVGGATRKLDALINLNVGYLSLSRTIPSLSDGERQRVRVATQLTCALRGLLYILDEPCKGLHLRDVDCIIRATNDLIARGNTVIAIEHNKRYIAAADNTIELGPVGGPRGGYLVEKSEDRQNPHQPLMFKAKANLDHFVNINGINFHNIKNQTAQFPIGGITCITGVSGSGKSTLATVIASCFNANHRDYCDHFQADGLIQRVIQVNQAPIGKTPRSTVVSYLGIFDEIRSLFASTDTARKLKLGASHFSMNVKGGRCECCQGTGIQKVELNYLPGSYITCPECNGKRFNEKILSVTYQGLTIQDVLETPAAEIICCFNDSKRIRSILQSMLDLGLGYLKLGQMSMNLSGGEAQRIKLAKALGVTTHGGNLYIFDEPTSGLNHVDADKFADVLLSLQAKGDTIVSIEHNVEFIAAIADYVIDFGLIAGNAGGNIVAQGTPATVFACKSSSLYGLSVQIE